MIDMCMIPIKQLILGYCMICDIIVSEDDAVSESKVAGTVASKFGGPRIAKEHVLDTTNCPTPRPHTRNLK
ncbi:hypothetical protein H5410_060017 [Solanum commersonii]|uniref:Uncharacterized protein n=1 Tax=Solanum commersonii TaxID=4109 RepID=A0A9J5W3Y6_SOLCO|nr:hypothetical protein H5410_060017 [Solanum commersonii]